MRATIWPAGTLLSWWILAAAIAPAAGSEVAPPTTVATVNGEAITIEDLEKRLEGLHGAVGATRRSAADLDRLLFRVVNDVLIGQEARALGLHLEPPVPETIERNRQRLALSVLRREEIAKRSQVSDQEIEELFQERYRRATFHVLTASDLEGAEWMLAQLRQGADIEALAREKSIDPYAAQGGLLEGVARRELQIDIADVVFVLSPNEVVGPVQTELGWSIFAVRSLDPPDREVLPRVRPNLVSLVRHRKEAAARQELVQELRSRHAVSIDEELVASIQPLRRPDGRLTAESPGPEAVVAKIGEDLVLTGEEYAVALERRWSKIPEEDAARAAAPILLERLLEEKLLLAEAYARGYHELPAVERALHALETEILVPQYLTSVLAAGIEVSEEEKRAHYEENKSRLKKPPRVRLGRITVATEEKARDIARALRGGTDLAWLAARHSTDGLRDKGGDEGWSTVQPGGGSLASALLEARPGDVLDPVQQEESWVVYKVLGREELGVYPYEEISGNMREAVFKEKFTQVLDRFIKTARSRSEIEINKEVLSSLRLTGTVTEEPQHPTEGHGH